MRRREFITLLGGAGAAWPVTARAQQPAMPVVRLSQRSVAWTVHLLGDRIPPESERSWFHRGEQNIAIEYGRAEGEYDCLPALAVKSGGPAGNSDCRYTRTSLWVRR